METSMLMRIPFILLAVGIAHAAPVSDDMFSFVAKSGGPGEVKTFVAKAGGIDATDSRGMTLLMHAAQAGKAKNVAALLDAGAAVAVRDTLGRDALDFALLGGNHQAAELLIEHGADPDRMYENGQTRLTMGALRGDIGTVHFLLLHGADPTRKSREGLDLVESVRKAGVDLAVDRLIDRRPEPAKTPKGLSAKDSARLYAVTEYTNRDSLLGAIQAGRRSFAGCSMKELDLAGMNLAFLDLSDADLEGCDLRDAMLLGARLRNASLRKAYLRKANLQWTDLNGTVFADAYLTLADLREAKGLELNQLKRAHNLYGTRLEADLREQVQQYCKPLLEDPGSEWRTNPWFAEAKDLPGQDETNAN
ncbi:MAG: hypothetical protein GF331_22990 [Chitinivibrionales bacterium]|nr:hypothetical protein [Chitinivibrionales bacterium]